MTSDAVPQLSEASAQTPPKAGGGPHTWVMMGRKEGDNRQLQALVETLGWAYETMRFAYRRSELLTNLLLGPNLLGMRAAESSPLRAPWPELILTAGRRNEPIARWIKRQSGGRTKLVHLGRPWARPEAFDLIVTTPQYRLPPGGNVLENETVIHGLEPERLTAAAEALRSRLSEMTRPLIAVLVGGSAGPFALDAESATRLAQEAQALAEREGGTLLVTTSARTATDAVDALKQALPDVGLFYRWRPGDPNNPYLGLLGLADILVATGESISMATEACATGKPVYLFDMGRRWFSMRRPARLPRLSNLLADFDRRALVYRLALAFGPRRLVRDLQVVPERFVANGRAAWLGDPAPQGSPPPLRDLERAAEAVEKLFAD